MQILEKTREIPRDGSFLEVTYRLTQSEKVIEDELVTVYGLGIYQKDRVSKKETYFERDDISTKKEFVHNLFDLIERHTVLTIGADDIIEEYIN
ncbi:MAG: DUF6514 family protein [Oscillospiraceae bacterium]|nr:DUF6514 family protein [Oscillospiraceae bacterium]